MNKHAIIVGFLATFIVASVWFLVFHDEAVAPSHIDVARPGSSGSVERNQSAVVSETFAGTGSFEDLVGLGKDLTCNFSSVSDATNAAIAGTVQVSGSYLRSDFEMQQGGETYDAHLIHNGQYTYSWTKSDAGVVAVRTPMNAEASPARPVVMDGDVDYQCQAWEVDSSVFVPPQELVFTDSEILNEDVDPSLETP